MAKISANLTSPNASKYMQQLCKHFAHKVTAVWDEETAHVTFDQGTCRMHATPDNLALTIETGDVANIQQLIFVVEAHLVGFAWREDCDLVWHDDSGRRIGKSEKLETGLAERRARFADKRRDGDDAETHA